MKYSKNLPLRSYQTALGPFTMVDLCSYYTVDEVNIQKSQINLDKSTTLVEAAYNVYGDIDSFWLFLFANKKINPFTLANENNTVKLQNDKTLEGVAARDQNTVYDSIFLAGSVVLPKTNNTGSAWNYGSTGNFSLTGGFAIVDSFNPFSKRFISKTPSGFTYDPGIGQAITGLIPSATGGFKTYDAGKTAQVEQVDAKLGLPEEIIYLTSETKQFIKVKSEYPIFAKGGNPTYVPSTDQETTITVQESIEQSTNDIEIYLPATVQYSNFTKIVQKYVV